MPEGKIYPVGCSRYIKEMSAIQDQQYYTTVAKSNELIRKGCYGLSTVQQKLLCYLIADIKDTDTSETVKEYNLKDIYDFLCVNSNSTEVMKNVTAIDKKSWWIVNDTESIRYRFFNTLIVTHDNKIKFSFHETILPYLQNLFVNKNYTYYRILYILCMKSEYSIRLYEMLKAAENLQVWHYDLDYLKEQLDCTDKYSRFGDFKKRVIDPAVIEINEQTDITVSYSMYKNPRGHNFNGIEFYIKTKDKIERLNAERGLRDKLNASIENNHKNRVVEKPIPERKEN